MRPIDELEQPGHVRHDANFGAHFNAPSARKTPEVDVEGLAAALRENVRGEVRFDDGARALYATDSSNYRQVPIGVVVPLMVDDVIATVDICRRFDAPIVSRGGGTSLAGQTCNVAVVMDFSKYVNAILELDPERRTARIQPGIVLDVLRDAAERYHLTFGPDPSTHNRCTLGGMLGNNSCGMHAQMAGRVSEQIEWLDILTYDGIRMKVGATSEEEYQRIQRAGGRRAEIYGRLKALANEYGDRIRAFPKLPRRISGYPLEELLPENGFHVGRALVGTEGTCVTILEAKVKLVHSPPVRSMLVLGYPDVYHAGDHVVEVAAAGAIALEGLDDVLLNHMHKKHLHDKDASNLPPGKGFLMVEFGGETKQESDDKARALMETLERRPNPPSMKLLDNPVEEAHLWTVREAGLGATARVPGEKDTWEGWEDSAVPPDKLGTYLRELRKLFDTYGYGCALYGHFGQGCVHTRIDFQLDTRSGIARYRRFVEEAADLVVSLGGSLSGEHGDGQSRGELLERMYGKDMVHAFEQFKAIWDPKNRMNPGKVVHPYRLDENLRLGPGFEPAGPATHFKFPEDKGSFGYAALRCVGVGECRRHEHGTMCPSYMVTREEMHSTRGRAHLLFEMLENGATRGGWRDESVKEALDLCLACKGCKSDCPMNVDMATYKAEFLAHYYQGRLRPRPAYAMGLIPWWAKLASVAPELVNAITHAPGISWVFKKLGGVAQQRDIPRFAPITFREAFRLRPRPITELPRVLLWPDTFNNHFHPQTAISAVEVLEKAGFQVDLPRKHLCCGRPLYDYGMLDLAKLQLVQILDALEDELDQGTPIVVLEPSCAAVFRDEMLQLFPDEPRAHKLASLTFVLSEFLEKKALGVPLPGLKRKAVVHGHCHHKSVLKFDAQERVMKRVGLDAHTLDSGCCGMAGAFGYQAGSPYEVSQRAGERVLLPQVRKADDATVILSDGFSCRSQIEQSSDRRALHLADAIALAYRFGPSGPAGRAEDGLPPLPKRALWKRVAPYAALLGLGALVARPMARRLSPAR